MNTTSASGRPLNDSATEGMVYLTDAIEAVRDVQSVRN